MAKEETTLEKMKKAISDGGEARRQIAAHEEAIAALSHGTEASIDCMRVKLLEDGQVAVYGMFDPREGATIFSERQFLGLMGWGHKHVGDGPNGKTPE